MGCPKDDLPSQKLEGIIVETAFFVFLGASCLLKPPKIGSMGDVDKSFPVHAWIIKTKRPRPGRLGRVKSNQPSTWLSAENWPTWSLTSILGGEPFVKNGSTSWGNLKYPTIVGNKLEPTEGFEIKLPVARGCCRYHWTCWEILSPKNTVSKIYCSIGWKCLFLMMMGYGTISNKLVLDRGFLVHINGMKSESKFFISPTLYISISHLMDLLLRE